MKQTGKLIIWVTVKNKNFLKRKKKKKKEKKSNLKSFFRFSREMT